MKSAAGIFLTLLLMAAAAKANDGMAELGAGGIRILQSDDIALLEEDLFLSVEQVRVRFRFRNETALPVSTLVAFVAPDADSEDLGRRDLIGSGRLAAGMAFTAEVDGRRVPVFTDLRAVAGDADITGQLHELGIDPEQMEPAPSQRQKLREKGLPLSGWKLRIRFYWRQLFPPGQTVEIEHRYRPFAGSAITQPRELYFADGDWSPVQRYCMNDDIMQGAHRLADAARQRLGYETLHARFLSYILTTGAGWRGPIGRLGIVIDSGHPQAVLATCLPGLKRTGPARYALEWHNVKPAEDIRLMFLLPADW